MNWRGMKLTLACFSSARLFLKAFPECFRKPNTIFEIKKTLTFSVREDVLYSFYRFTERQNRPVTSQRLRGRTCAYGTEMTSILDVESPDDATLWPGGQLHVSKTNEMKKANTYKQTDATAERRHYFLHRTSFNNRFRSL